MTQCLHMFPHCAHGQSHEAHSDYGLWSQYFLCGHFFYVIRATPKGPINNVTHELGIILALRTTFTTNCSYFLLITNPWFFIVHCTNNETIHHQLVHVLPNQPICHETYLWMNRRLFIDWYGSFQWLHLYLAMHKVSCDNLQPTFQSWVAT